MGGIASPCTREVVTSRPHTPISTAAINKGPLAPAKRCDGFFQPLRVSLGIDGYIHTHGSGGIQTGIVQIRNNHRNRPGNPCTLGGDGSHKPLAQDNAGLSHLQVGAAQGIHARMTQVPEGRLL